MAAPIRTTPDAPTCGNIRTARFCRCCARPGSAASPRPPSACGFPHGFRGAPACRRGSTCFPRRWRAPPRRAPPFSVAPPSEARPLLPPPGFDPPAGCRRIDFGAWGETGIAPPRSEVDPGPDDRAEVVFTSGTTGEPKGVVLTHDNLASDFAPILHGFDRRESFIRPLGSLRLISTLPLSHMFGQALNVFLGLHMGLTIVLVPPRPREILQAARRH